MKYTRLALANIWKKDVFCDEKTSVNDCPRSFPSDPFHPVPIYWCDGDGLEQAAFRQKRNGAECISAGKNSKTAGDFVYRCGNERFRFDHAAALYE